jgi:hypothetical protein
MRFSRLDRVRLASQPKQNQRVELAGLEDLARLIVHPTKPLLPTQKDFIFYPGRIAHFMGPVGAAKTSALVGSLLLPSLLYPGGVWGLFRATWWTLEQTTLRRFMESIDRLGRSIIVDKEAGPPMKLWLHPAVNNPDGSPGAPVEWIFHGLDDIGKLGSTEFTGIGVDEIDELPEPMVDTLNMRLRHRLPHQEVAEGPFFLRSACNPVRRSHWVHYRYCGEESCLNPPFGKKFRPLRRENESNLPPGYYDELAAGMSPETKLRYIEGECGPDISGSPVFRNEFRSDLHVGDLLYYPSLPLILSIDFGRRRPACVWSQRTPEGFVNRLSEFLGEEMNTDRFAKTVNMLTATRFPHVRKRVEFCDPHGTAKKSVSDESDIDIMRRNGFQLQYRDVAKKTGLEKMSEGLNTLIKGRPRSMYNRKGTPLLIEGYVGGYTYPDAQPGKPLKEEPVADGFYEHLMDCDRYLEVNLGMGSSTPKQQQGRVLRKIRNPVTGY